MTSDEIIFEALTMGHENTREIVKWAIQKEREVCAKLVDDEWGRWAVPVNSSEYNYMWEKCIKLIRSRGEK